MINRSFFELELINALSHQQGIAKMRVIKVMLTFELPRISSDSTPLFSHSVN